MTRLKIVLLLVLAPAPALLAQPHVDVINMHERAIAIVPIVGAGTYEDPHRPLLAPAPGKEMPGLISWSWEPSDDGKLAIVEYVLDSKAALRSVRSNAKVVRSFEKGKDRQDDIERELRQYKKSYRLNKAAVRRPE